MKSWFWLWCGVQALATEPALPIPYPEPVPAPSRLPPPPPTATIAPRPAVPGEPVVPVPAPVPAAPVSAAPVSAAPVPAAPVPAPVPAVPVPAAPAAPAPAVPVPVAQPRPVAPEPAPVEPVPAPVPAPGPIYVPVPTPLPESPLVPPLPPRGNELAELLPDLPRRGLWQALGLGALAVIASVVGQASRKLSDTLLPHGLFPRLLRGLEVVCRATLLISVVGVGLAMVPERLAPAIPWLAIALALALGWSARDVLPDLVAWTFLAAEGRIRGGIWVQGADFEGVVESVRPRTTTMVDARSQRIAVPNRLLVGAAVRTDARRHPQVELALRLPGVDAAAARQALGEAVLLSPWLAPGVRPEIGVDPTDPDLWRVRVRLLDLRFHARFEGTFPERVREVLGA
jgi:hypothetical protein